MIFWRKKLLIWFKKTTIKKLQKITKQFLRFKKMYVLHAQKFNFASIDGLLRVKSITVNSNVSFQIWSNHHHCATYIHSRYYDRVPWPPPTTFPPESVKETNITIFEPPAGVMQWSTEFLRIIVLVVCWERHAMKARVFLSYVISIYHAVSCKI